MLITRVFIRVHKHWGPFPLYKTPRLHNDATYKRDWTLPAQSITRTCLKLGMQQVPMTFPPIGGG